MSFTTLRSLSPDAIVSANRELMQVSLDVCLDEKNSEVRRPLCEVKLLQMRLIRA